MYCKNCNKSFDKNAKFCDKCGERLIENIKSTNKTTKESKKKIGLIISLIVVAAIIVIGSTIFFGISLYKYLDKIGTIEYIKLGNDKIPTIYTIDKNIQIDSYNKNVSLDEIEVEIEYYDNIYNNNMLNIYIELLEINGFTYIEDEIEDWYLVKESIDEGKIIIINIYEQKDYEDEIYFSIEYEKENGNISDHIKEPTYKRVGESKFGFIDIDSTWKPLLGQEDMIQYESDEGFLTLYYIEKPSFTLREYMNSIYSYVEQEGASEINTIEVTVDGYKAYQLSAYYDDSNTYIAIWCFIDNNNTIHYIEMDALEKNSKAFSKIESYSVLK